MDETWIYLCEDSLDGIFTAVYQAYEERHPHAANRIQIGDRMYHQELFARYIPVETDYERAEKVARTLRNKVSIPVYEWLKKCSVSYDPGKADGIYRGIILALHMGGRVMDHLTRPEVQYLMELERHIVNEIQHELQFLRFEELENGVLFAKINPKDAVLPYMAEHFADRFSGENWVIADTVHRTLLLHESGKGCTLAEMSDLDLEALELSVSASEELWQKLWKRFVDSIAIKERINPRLQMQMLPKRFRKYMKEMQEP
jgi:probable DNA metabolism protein